MEAPVAELSQAAQKIFHMADKYLSAMKLNTGREPPVIQITKAQAQTIQGALDARQSEGYGIKPPLVSVAELTYKQLPLKVAG